MVCTGAAGPDDAGVETGAALSGGFLPETEGVEAAALGVATIGAIGMFGGD